VWFTITWLNIEGNPIKREILHRLNGHKVWKFLEVRISRGRIPADATGFWFRESEPDEVWDYDIDEAHSPGHHAVEIPISKIEPTA